MAFSDDVTPEQIAQLTARAEEVRDLMRSAARTPSKAHLIGYGSDPGMRGGEANFFTLVARANSSRLSGSGQGMFAAKAALEDMGSYWAGTDPESKATIGDTDAAGGYIVPNNVVGAINEQATPMRGVVDLFTNIGGVRGSSVDIPWEQDEISRAVIAPRGETKQNSNLALNNYTATLYTLARIFDIGNQLLRQSEGAAEKLVRTKLGRAFALGEDYYSLSGSGTNEPYGLLTALGTTGEYVSTFSSPADTTVAGSVASAVAAGAGELEDRGAFAEGVVMNTRDYWRMRRQGSDTAGFWIEPDGARNRDLSLFGIPVRHTPNIASDTLVVGEFSAVTFFRGEAYRVDTSSEAGDRWDKNLTGFRGESEIAFDARPAVFTGKFQRITNAVGA